MSASISQLSKELQQFFKASTTPELTLEQIKDIVRWAADKIDRETRTSYSKGYSDAKSDIVDSARRF